MYAYLRHVKILGNTKKCTALGHLRGGRGWDQLHPTKQLPIPGGPLPDAAADR